MGSAHRVGVGFPKDGNFYRFISILKTGHFYRFILISRRPLLPFYLRVQKICSARCARAFKIAATRHTRRLAAPVARLPTSDTRSAAMLSPHSSQLPHTSMQSLHALTSPLSSVLQRSSTYVETDRVGSRTQNSCHFYGFTQLVLHFYRFTRILCTCTLLPFYAKTCSLLPYLHPMPANYMEAGRLRRFRN